MSDKRHLLPGVVAFAHSDIHSHAGADHADLTPTATPAPDRVITFGNGLSQSMSDLHATFTRDVTRVSVLSNPPGCNQPNFGGPQNHVDVVWSTACVDPGESVTLGFNFSNQDSILWCWYWTLFGSPFGDCPTPSPTTTATPSPCPQCTPTPTPAPGDAGITRLKPPHNVRLRPGETNLATLTVSATSDPQGFNLYVALLPPGGQGNPGGCTAGVLEGISNVAQATFKFNVNWSCTNPAAVDGLNWEVRAFADVHVDDRSSCDSLTEAFDGTCEAALADDDSNDANNANSRSLPKVTAR